ncbi:MAG: sigma 54-interacting transcriptional regulator [Polyangiaceae bacterium]|nr:sigma 54-interacting transcriptional regulator [Polyangiaceae bacterium]
MAGGSWDEAVLRELQTVTTRALIVWVRHTDSHAHLGDAQELFVAGSTRDDADVWWQGVVDSLGSNDAPLSLSELDAWWRWSEGRIGHVPSEPRPQLSHEAMALLSRLHLAARPWPEAALHQLADARAISELDQCALVARHRGWVRLTRRATENAHEASADDYERVGEALASCFPQDAWAKARAGELLLQAGACARAEERFEDALHRFDNALARRHVWDAWTRGLRGVSDTSLSDSALHAARTALDCDDVDVALDMAQRAARAHAHAFDACYVLGRSQLARGDVVAAQVSLDRALRAAADDGLRAEAMAQLAEVAYVVGDLDRASQLAQQAMQGAQHDEVRLCARNTIGKVLLARSRWDEADVHFAGDEHRAGSCGLEVAQLRARVNRAIALLSKGRSEQARAMLESVLADGERKRDLRATSFALSNLAVLAVGRHEYGEALRLSERAIDTRRKLGDKVGLARVVTNLAELRLRLGLVREAEQALSFGRQTLSPGLPSTRAAHFALVAARICLARGDTAAAGREVTAAITASSGSSDGAFAGECLRVAARIALEDGDVERAARALRDAERNVASTFARAEVGLLRARLAQARGQNALELAVEALSAARDAGDDDLLRETSELLCVLYRVADEPEAARRHLDIAKHLRDEVASTLPEALRARYLARRDLNRISALEDALRLVEQAPAQSTPPRRAAMPTDPASRFVGQHPSVVRLLSAVRKLARSDAPVLVHGESGTGKELIAEALHALSSRANGPIVKVNCAALVDTLLLSELFGHEKGSFTGASSRRRGRFELADGGTLLLDEIGDISARTQVALLRVLQDHCFERVGGSTPLRADVRIVCATNRDLDAMVAAGCFREDLYYRLSGVTLRVPPLRERATDIPRIASHLLQQVARERCEAPKQLAPDALDLLQRHSWPGNVRELDNVLRAASLFAETCIITDDLIVEHITPGSGTFVAVDFPATPTTPPFEPPTSAIFPSAAGGDDEPTARLAYDQIRKQGTSLGDLKKTIERDCIRRALDESSGNITKAASLLGMKRPRLSQLVKHYGLLACSSEDES